MVDTVVAVQKSVETDGTDTVPSKATGFLDTDKITTHPHPANGDSESQTSNGYQMWSDEHEEASKARRERRENREKLPQVASVPDFDLKQHLAEKDKPDSSSSWKFWKK